MSTVRSRIARFEAHNAEIRTDPISPRAGQNGRVSDNENDSTRVWGMSGPRSDSGLSDHRPRSDVSLSAFARLDISDTASTTSNTSHLRRNRLQNESGRIEESSGPSISSSASIGTATLAERRRARQMRKQMQLKAKRTDVNTQQTESFSTPQTNETFKLAPKKSSRRQRPSPDSFVRQPTSDGLVGRSINMAPGTNSNDEHRQQHHGIDYGELQATPLVFDQPRLARHSPVDPTDDEATLTSVRQIMHAPIMPKLDNHDHLIGAPNSMVRSASSSSYETEGSRSLHDKNVKSSLIMLPPRDDDTFDYGDRDENYSEQDDSVVFDQEDSVAFEETRQAAAAYQKKESTETENGASSLLTMADVEHYCRSLDTPVTKIAASVAVASTVGVMILGPVGLLVGAATVGIGAGVMQIPEEQRNNVRDRATAALHRAHESAITASETLSSTCAASCHETNSRIPSEMKQCFASDETVTKDGDASIQLSERGTKGDDRSVKGASVANEKANQGQSKNRRVACLRNGRIVPVQQIYGLEPSQQPRAWLDVMASANTTIDEKNEAIEEIINHSKDKQRARALLDEGVLDSIIYIINCHFDKRGNVTKESLAHAKLAANCCVTLGKAHCAAVHTEGDLLLMSLYERGTVPEERQLAQMLYEVPHHVTRDGKPENFCLQQMNMPKAEDAARAIKALADGQQQPPSQ